MIKHSAYALGATLYMPATRPDILDVVLGEKIQGLRSLVVCLEDAVAEIDVQQGLNNLKNLLLGIEARGGRPSAGPILFVRPRDAAMAAVLNDWSLMRHVDGFVVPKLSLGNIREWQQAVTRDDLMLMPTLETPEVFVPNAMVELRSAMLELLPERIIALRIGGNDLKFDDVIVSNAAPPALSRLTRKPVAGRSTSTLSAPLVKMTSDGRAPRQPATVLRAASTAPWASRPTAYRPLGFPKADSRNGSIASRTSERMGEVAALSR